MVAFLEIFVPAAGWIDSCVTITMAVDGTALGVLAGVLAARLLPPNTMVCRPGDPIVRGPIRKRAVLVVLLFRFYL